MYFCSNRVKKPKETIITIIKTKQACCHYFVINYIEFKL